MVDTIESEFDLGHLMLPGLPPSRCLNASPNEVLSFAASVYLGWHLNELGLESRNMLIEPVQGKLQILKPDRVNFARLRVNEWLCAVEALAELVDFESQLG